MINIYKSGKYDITLEFDNFGLYNILNAFEKLKNKIETERYVFNKDSLPDIILANLINDAGILGAV